MAWHWAPKIYSVTLKKKRQIAVDVDRYTFVFRGLPTDIELECIAGMIHGKRDPEIDPHDLVALRAEKVAEAKARFELTLWARQNPSANLEHVQEAVIWLHPDCERVTPDEAALNRDFVEALIKSTVIQLPIWPTDPDPLP